MMYRRANPGLAWELLTTSLQYIHHRIGISKERPSFFAVVRTVYIVSFLGNIGTASTCQKERNRTLQRAGTEVAIITMSALTMHGGRGVGGKWDGVYSNRWEVYAKREKQMSTLYLTFNEVVTGRG